MDILEQIIAQKRKEVDDRMEKVPEPVLSKQALFGRPTRSLVDAIRNPDKSGIIAEFKRMSPSKGVINNRNTVEEVTAAYTAFGASGISVLTDELFFGGSLTDLSVARRNDIPLLRKDFVIEEYQLVEAKAYGADVVLLIAACLSPRDVQQLATKAKELHLEVLLEIHDASELDHVCNEVDLIGVNNRNLKNFEVNLEHSIRLAEKIPADFIKIAESGINDVASIRFLKENGFQGFLIGGHFMEQKDPMLAFKQFAKAL
jgi:indole-3-glycerol phosphate synthase